MKKFYNSPVVEITVFDVEDIITTSAAIPTISTDNMSTEDAAAFAGALEAQTGITAENTVAWNSSYEW